MSVLFCDTDCELWYTTAKELGVKVIGMPYTVDGEEKMYDLGENTDFKDFYARMRAGSSVSTAGLNKEIYLDIFRPYFEAGEDILYVAFSSKMSGTFEPLAAAIEELSEQFPDARYRKFDTLNICLGAGILVYLAAKFFNAHGGDIDATYDYLAKIVHRVKVHFVVGDLRYLARGGRLSPAKARMGNVLQAKPVLHVDKEGEISVLTKVIGANRFRGRRRLRRPRGGTQGKSGGGRARSRHPHATRGARHRRALRPRHLRHNLYVRRKMSLCGRR